MIDRRVSSAGFSLRRRSSRSPARSPAPSRSDDVERMRWSVTGETAFATFAGFCALLFAFDPAGPSRRVLVHWRRMGAGMMRRFFGPGLPKTASLVVLMCFLGLLAIPAIDMAMLYLQPTAPPTSSSAWTYYSPHVATRNDRLSQIFVFGAYCAPYFVFTAGLVAYFRSRGQRRGSRGSSPARYFPRVGGGAVGHRGDRRRGRRARTTTRGSSSQRQARSSRTRWLVSSIIQVRRTTRRSCRPVSPLRCSGGFFGFDLLVIAGRRCARAVREQNAIHAQTEAALQRKTTPRAPRPSRPTHPRPRRRPSRSPPAAPPADDRVARRRLRARARSASQELRVRARSGSGGDHMREASRIAAPSSSSTAVRARRRSAPHRLARVRAHRRAGVQVVSRGRGRRSCASSSTRARRSTTRTRDVRRSSRPQDASRRRSATWRSRIPSARKSWRRAKAVVRIASPRADATRFRRCSAISDRVDAATGTDLVARDRRRRAALAASRACSSSSATSWTRVRSTRRSRARPPPVTTRARASSRARRSRAALGRRLRARGRRDRRDRRGHGGRRARSKRTSRD